MAWRPYQVPWKPLTSKFIRGRDIHSHKELLCLWTSQPPFIKFCVEDLYKVFVTKYDSVHYSPIRTYFITVSKCMLLIIWSILVYQKMKSFSHKHSNTVSRYRINVGNLNTSISILKFLSFLVRIRDINTNAMNEK